MRLFIYLKSIKDPLVLAKPFEMNTSRKNLS